MPHKHTVGFRCSSESTNKEAIFKDENERQLYLAYEYRDLKVQDAFFAHSAARTPAQRRKTAKELDDIRFSCYRRWKSSQTKPRGPRAVA